MQLVQLQKDHKALEEAGIQVVAVSYDPVKALAEFAKQSGVAYPLLSDEGSKTITAYGILNEKARGFSKGIPHPGTFVIDQKGVIRAKLFNKGYVKRHTAKELIEAVK